MSVISRETPSYMGVVGAGLLDAAGGVATIVLAILGLTGIDAPVLTSIAVVVFGAELVARGGMIISAVATAATRGLLGAGEYGGGVAAMFLAGFAGIILGILAILGLSQFVLLAVSVIGFGMALVLSGGSSSALLNARPAETIEGSTNMESVPIIAGLVAIVLGVLALVLVGRPANLSLVMTALLILGAAVLVSGGSLGLILRSLAPRE